MGAREVGACRAPAIRHRRLATAERRAITSAEELVGSMMTWRRRENGKGGIGIGGRRLVVRPFVTVVVYPLQRVKSYHEWESPDDQDECLYHLSGTFLGAATRLADAALRRNPSRTPGGTCAP